MIMTPYGERWVQVYRDTHGDAVKAAAIMGRSREVAMMWRAKIYGPVWHRRSSVLSLNHDNIEELRAALEAHISPYTMAYRFGVTRSTMRNIINQYGLPRIRKLRTPKQPSKVW